MRTVHGIEELVMMGVGLSPGESRPCILVAPELLIFASSGRETVVREEFAGLGEEISIFQPDHRRAVRSMGVMRVPGSLEPRYRPIEDGTIACGVTRVSLGEFAQARDQLDHRSGDQGAFGQYAEGDLVRLSAFRTASGPGVVIDVQTSRVLPEIAHPRLALNPFGTLGWKYLESIFSTAAFFWAVTDGERAFVLSSIQEFYPEIVARVHQRCLSFAREAGERDWPRALAEIRRLLRE